MIVKETPKSAAVADKLIRKIKATGKQFTVKDSRISGLALLVTALGHKSWLLRYRFNGKQRNYVFAKFLEVEPGEGITCNQARQEAATMKESIRQGTDPAGKPEQKGKGLTMLELRNRWHERVLKDKYKDGGAYALGWLDRYVMPKHGERPTAEFNRFDIMEIVEQLKLEGKQRASTVVLATTKQLLTYAVKMGIIESNPLEVLTRADAGGRDSERERVLCEWSDPDSRQVKQCELLEFFEKLEVSGLWDGYQAALKIMLSTLARVGELSQAEWSNVDFRQGRWLIPKKDSKNGRAHSITLSCYALEQFKLLHDLTGTAPFVFPSGRNEGRPIEAKTITKQVRDRQRDKPLAGRSSRHFKSLVLSGGAWTPHDLRRTGATLMSALGVQGAIIEHCLNHLETNKMARIYQRHTPSEEMAEAWSRLGEHLDSIKPPPAAQ